MAKQHPLTITNPELDLHQSGVVVFRGTAPAGATLDFTFAARQSAQRAIGPSGTWEVRMRVPGGQRRIEATATLPDGTTQSARRSVRFIGPSEVAALASADASAHMQDPGAPLILTHARLGIGVTDPEWWRLRFETIAHIMLPSLVNAHVLGHRVLLAVDAAIAQDVLERLKQIVVASGAAGFTDIVFTDSVWTYPHTVENYMRLHFGDVPSILHGIDDDDAISGDFFNVARAKVAAEDPTKVQLHTVPFGLSYNIELHRVQLGAYPWYMMNQFAYGRPGIIHTIRAHSHNQIQVEGARRGWTVRVHEEPRLSYLYTHHKQSDSGYVKRLETMRLNDQAFALDATIASHFGIHLEPLRDLSSRIDDMPSVSGRTWRASTQYQDAERNMLRATESIKQLRLAATREIVDRVSLPVPAPELSVKRDIDGDPQLVRLSGGYAPDHFVRVRVDGEELTSLLVPRSGTWSYPLRLTPGTHSVEISAVSLQARVSGVTSAEVSIGSQATGD